jgi:hypothetical protein
MLSRSQALTTGGADAYLDHSAMCRDSGQTVGARFERSCQDFARSATNSAGARFVGERSRTGQGHGAAAAASRLRREIAGAVRSSYVVCSLLPGALGAGGTASNGGVIGGYRQLHRCPGRPATSKWNRHFLERRSRDRSFAAFESSAVSECRSLAHNPNRVSGSPNERSFTEIV